MSQKAHQANLRKGRVSLPNHAYYITKCINRNIKINLAESIVAETVINTMFWMHDKGWVRLCGFVIMPDHYHWIIGLTGRKTLPQVMHGIGIHSAQMINRILSTKGKIWEESFYDHAIRNRADLDSILAYMHLNPVRAGLCLTSEEWEYSSAHHKYFRRIDWDWIGTNIS